MAGRRPRGAGSQSCRADAARWLDAPLADGRARRLVGAAAVAVRHRLAGRRAARCARTQSAREWRPRRGRGGGRRGRPRAVRHLRRSRPAGDGPARRSRAGRGACRGPAAGRRDRSARRTSRRPAGRPSEPGGARPHAGGSARARSRRRRRTARRARHPHDEGVAGGLRLAHPDPVAAALVFLPPDAAPPPTPRRSEASRDGARCRPGAPRGDARRAARSARCAAPHPVDLGRSGPARRRPGGGGVGPRRAAGDRLRARRRPRVRGPARR